MRLDLRFLIASALLAGCVSAAVAFDYVTWPDGRRVRVVQANPQLDLSSLKSGMRGHVLDRRFNTNEGEYLANEMYLSGTEFFLRAGERKLPIAHDRQFAYIANIEAYWYSRYNLVGPTIRARLGIGLVNGPYIDLLAKSQTRLNRFGRDRGELVESNKQVMLSDVVGSFLKRSGMPYQFDNAVPTMLEFKSGDPKFVMPVNTKIDKYGRPTYLDDFESLRWSNDSMDHNIDMGGVGQAMLKKVLWSKFFLRRNHTDIDFPGEVFLGNNAEDGFRGGMLALASLSTMMMTKAALFVDPSHRESHLPPTFHTLKLVGIDPRSYHPDAGLRYIPHEIHPTLTYIGDLPVRQYDFSTKDVSSQLWDQASWLWATSEYFDFSNPRKRDNWNNVFGYQTPYDGSILPQKYALLAQDMANVVLDNMKAMHRVDGVLVSSWQPGKGPGHSVRISDLALAMVALDDFGRNMDLEPAREQDAKQLLQQQADFLLGAQAADGSFVSEYQVPGARPSGEPDSTSQAFGIRAMLVAYHALGDKRYLDAAHRASANWNSKFWDKSAWLYRNTPESDQVVYTPVDVAATLGALRELVLVDRDMHLLDRFKKFFVQAVDSSGLQQAEDLYTGEDIRQVRTGDTDSDGDGIPFVGTSGIDSVFASKVAFDLGQPAQHPVAAPARPHPVTGEQIFAANCEVCHGKGGVGTEGPTLIDNSFVQLTGRDGVIRTVTDGRVGVGMPTWGGVLTADEIGRVVDYIRGLHGAEPDKQAVAK
ncbi:MULTISPECIES: c-type cytochrome [Rhodanobacter]|uniref:c-type cytochrome n=1 Tax=Rhodanobacter TaxID=75309 RepID=UPI0004023414|nr:MULTISPECIES: c-type cytochrome [Rhodanobacter]UJJ54111.1 c-type cytochrome [Rhodanobacter thiooxydans]